MQLKNLILVFAFFATSVFSAPAPAADPLFGLTWGKLTDDPLKLQGIIYYIYLDNHMMILHLLTLLSKLFGDDAVGAFSNASPDSKIW